MAIVTNPSPTISKAVVAAAQTNTTTSANSTSGTTSTSTSTNVTGTNKGIADNFNQFLSLLTTQLQHQDPTAPLDTNQFTQQLVEFSQVEQQLKTNTKLDTLISQTGGGSQVSSLLGYVGLTATVKSSSATLASGKAQWTLNAPSQTNSANIVIKDSSGNQVASFAQQFSAGSQTIVWDGTTSSGSTAPDGVYNIQVTAKSASGSDVAISTTSDVVISGIDSSSGTAKLLAGSLSFTPDQIVAVTR